VPSCAIVGAGPAGLFLGLLLARQGIEVTVFERQPDFDRSFRGNTLNPASLELLDQAGLLDEVLSLPHAKTIHFTAVDARGEVRFADFGRLGGRHPYVALVQQSDLLPILARAAHAEPTFRLVTGASVVNLLKERGAVVGVEIEAARQLATHRADLVIGTDGRHSAVRQFAGLEADDVGAPIDVLWFTLPRKTDDDAAEGAYFRFGPGMMLALMDALTHWQVGAIIRKGSFETIRREGITAFRETVAATAPPFADRMDELTGWDDIALLEVQVDRLRSWYRPGVLCLGDAAHAMSPVGMVGINLALKDAYVAAGALGPHLRYGSVPISVLRSIQRRRATEVRLLQRAQVIAHRMVLRPALDAQPALPGLLRALMQSRPSVRIATQVIARGVGRP